MSVALIRALHESRQAAHAKKAATDEVITKLREQFVALPKRKGRGARLGVVDQLRLAALSFGAATFTREMLTVRAWLAWPSVFGMRGYEAEYPDANRVYAALYGAKGLIKRGQLARIAGDKLAAQLNGEQRADPVPQHPRT